MEHKWYKLIRSPNNTSNHPEILELIENGTCLPDKVMPWLVGNPQKINT